MFYRDRFSLFPNTFSCFLIIDDIERNLISILESSLAWFFVNLR